MKHTIALVFTVLLFVIGCTDRDDKLTAINIRVKNASSISFDKIQVGGDEFVHTDISSGSFSDYLEYETAYRYAYIAIHSGTESYVLQPIDFVGETPLGIGFYTYVLDVSEDGEVSLNFVQD